MDQSFIVPSEIKENLESCILRTNFVLNRWLTVNNVPSKRILDSDAKTILLGNIKKYVFKGKWVDFRKLSHTIKIYITDDTRLISHITYDDIDLIYCYNKQLMKELLNLFSTLDYKKLQEIKIIQEITLEKTSETTELNIDFNTIKNITF